MKVTDLHFELHVRDLAAAKQFYVDRLGLTVLQETDSMNLLAVRVGNSRMSIFGDRTEENGPSHSQIILAVDDIVEAVGELQINGVDVSGPPISAGTFLKFVTIIDPDGNKVAISQYLRPPIEPI